MLHVSRDLTVQVLVRSQQDLKDSKSTFSVQGKFVSMLYSVS